MPVEVDHLTALRRDLGVAGLAAGRIVQVGGGRSALTAIVDIEADNAHHKVAVRAELRDRAGLRIGSLSDMFSLHEQLQREGIPAPAPILVSAENPDATYDLLVTEFVSGEVPQPWRRAGRESVHELREGARFGREFVETLARVHNVSLGSLPAGIAHEREGAAITHPHRSRGRSKAWVQNSGVFACDPVLNYVDVWLESNQCSETFRAGLVHGDYRMGNLVIRDGSLGSILDWELAEAGEVLSDVAWLCGPQGSIDGFAGGLFAEEDLVKEYEAVSGRAVSADLFSYLKVEGTLRTAAVWAQLSADEARRGDFPQQRRCQDSVLRLIGQCAESLGVLDFRSDHSGHDALLLRGLAATRSAVTNDLQSEGGGRTLLAAARSATLLVDQLTALLAGGPYGDYVDHCAKFVARSGVELPDPDLCIPEQVTWVLRALGTRGAGDLDSAEVLEVVSRSAAPGIAFANQMVMSARRDAQALNEGDLR